MIMPNQHVVTVVIVVFVLIGDSKANVPPLIGMWVLPNDVDTKAEVQDQFAQSRACPHGLSITGRANNFTKG
jgi:hypothetical protein